MYMGEVRSLYDERGIFMVTMQKIAELCGVSRGTVDRVMHGRGRVSTETAAHIMQIAKELGYEPNPAGKALAARKKQSHVAVILPSEGNPFFDEVIRGLQTSAEFYSSYGLKMELYTMKGYNAKIQLDILNRVSQSVEALIINPIDDESIREALDKLVDEGKFIVTVNNDASTTKRHCYVGADYENSGITACALLAALTKARANVGIVLGNRQVLGHCKRLEGFFQRMDSLPDFHVAAVVENEDDDICSYDRTKAMLAENPHITALYLAAGGVYGACRAVMELPGEKRPLVIAVDSVPTTVEMMKNGIITAVIYQHPYRQGRRAMEVAFEYLINGRQPRYDEYLVKNEIKLLENL